MPTSATQKAIRFTMTNIFIVPKFISGDPFREAVQSDGRLSLSDRYSRLAIRSDCEMCLP
jgi:hypothetical protein